MKQFPAIKKQYLLLAGALVLAVISYQLAFRKTIDAWQIHQRYTQQLEKGGDVSSQPDYLNRENDRLDKILLLYQLDSTSFRDNAVNRVAMMAEQERVKLTVVPTDEAVYHGPRFILQKMVFEGSFFSLLKLADRLEAEKEIGVLRSVSWKMQKSKAVAMEIYLEIYRK